MTLQPTLWRTCRILAGATRLQLLRLVVREPGQTVSRLAEATSISLTRASQELRRLQSRGLLQTKRKGSTVQYYPTPDPLVATAKPLLAAMKSTFTRIPPAADQHVIEIATALSHPRRIIILAELLKSPRNFHQLHAAVHIPVASFKRHLHLLHKLGMAGKTRLIWRFTPGRHPLALCLMHILKSKTFDCAN
jgi:DNA-binding transcriptional ArsR family regulator